MTTLVTPATSTPARRTTPPESAPRAAAAGAFTRRSMLRGMGMTGLAAMAAPSLLDGGQALAAPHDPNHRGRPAPKKVRGGAGAQPTPYALQASSELSREFFSTSEVLIGDGDEIFPFINPGNNNLVEALVFASGTVNHLHRDPTSPSGWAYSAVPATARFTSIAQVAVAASATGVFLLVFGTTQGAGGTAAFTWLTGPTTWSEEYFASLASLGIENVQQLSALKGGVSRQGRPYFTAALTLGNTTELIGWLQPDPANPQPLAFQRLLAVNTAASGAVQDATILWDGTGSSRVTSPTGFAVVLLNNGSLSVFPQNGTVFSSTAMADAGTTGVTALLWAWASTSSTTGRPGYAVQTANGTVFSDEGGNVNAVADTALKGGHAVAVWQLNDLYTVNLLDANGTLQMVQQLSSSGTGSWATPLPLVPDLQAVFSVPTDPTENTLFAVGLDQGLNVLSLGSSGWTQTTIHQSSEETYDFSAYRIQTTVTDANGTAVPGSQVTVATDRPVAAWTPTGSVAITPDAPVTVTTDVKGQFIFSIPAEELDVAMLTLQALDSAGNPTGGTYLVTADTDLRAFLGGTGTLTDQGQLSGATLTNATQPGTSTPLFPVLSAADAANQSVQALNQLIKTGSDAQNGTVKTASPFFLDLSSGSPTYAPLTQAEARDSKHLRGKQLTFSFDHLFHSIGHAIRHGAMSVVSAAVKLAEDGVHWAVGLALKIGDAYVNFTDLVITDMKSAFHVIGGFFATLGADIKSAVEWLAHDVIALLKAAKGTATQLQTWFVDLGSNATSALDTIQIDADNWFSAQETRAHTEISDLKNIVEGTLGGPTLPAPTDTGSASSQSALFKDLGYLGRVMNDTPGVWLMHKFLSHLPVTDPGPAIDQSTFQPLVQQLATDWVDAMALSESLWTFVQTTMSDAFSSNGAADKGKLTNTQVTQWFTDLDNVVHDGLQFLDAITDTLLDVCKAAIALIEGYFTYQYNLVASMGLVGYILEKAGVDIHFSLSEILSWIVAFPATLIARCRGYSAVYPNAVSVASGRVHGRELETAPDGWQVGLGITGAVAQGVWGFADLVGDLQQLPDNGKVGTPSGLIDYFDILCPVVETIALWPSEPNSDGTASYPFKGGLATSTKYWELLPFVIFSALLPSAFGALDKAGWLSQLKATGFPSGVTNIVNDYMGPMVQMIAGTANTILGGVYSGKNDAGWVAILGTVIGNLSFIGAPLATAVMKEATEDASVLVKMAIDAGGNIGAAVCIAEATSLPTP